MKVMITGNIGQLGIELTKQLEGLSHDVIGNDYDTLDITNLDNVMYFAKENRPNVIVNCAAYTNVDGAESDESTAYKVNAIGAKNLSIAAYEISAKIVQISTDFIFDGKSTNPIKEYDAPNPLSVYGKSKLMGELMVRETNPRHFILRTAWLYGEGNNFVRTMLRLAKEKDELSVVSDQVGTPTSTAELAKCIINLIGTGNYGTYNASCEGSCSWNEFAKKIFELKNLSVKVNEMTTEELARPAERPKFSVMENFTLNLIGMNTFPNWEEALKDYLETEN